MRSPLKTNQDFIEEESMLVHLEVIKMAKKIVLPKFLITIEMFNEIKDPPLKNPVYNEINYKI